MVLRKIASRCHNFLPTKLPCNTCDSDLSERVFSWKMISNQWDIPTHTRRVLEETLLRADQRLKLRQLLQLIEICGMADLRWSLLTVTCVVNMASAEMFTSLLNVQQVIRVEEKLVHHLRTYIDQELQRLEDIRRWVTWVVMVISSFISFYLNFFNGIYCRIFYFFFVRGYIL